MKKNETAGSSLVRLGNTQVLCGISLQIGTPISNNARRSGGSIGTTMAGIAANHGTVGNSGGGDVVVVLLSTQQQQQQQQAAVAATEEQLQSIISNMLDLSALIIIDGQAAWRIQLTIQVLQDDGNVWDATLLAAVAALTDVNLPATKFMSSTTTRRNGTTSSSTTTSTAKTGTTRLELVEQDDTDNDNGRIKTPLVFHYLPVPLTVGVYRSHSEQDSGIHLVADPTPDEAPLLQGYLTMVVTDEDDIVYARHASQVGLTRQHLAVAAHMAYGRGKEIRALLQE